MKDIVTWKIAGEAGFGIISSGIMLAKTFARSGYHVFADNDYPSLIRGGHNVVSVRIGTQPFYGMNEDLHCLVALNAEAVEKHTAEMKPGTIVLFDPNDKAWTNQDVPSGVLLVSLPLKDIVSSLHAEPIMRNTVALGATVALFGGDFAVLSEVIKDQFSKKGESVVSGNIAIAKAGYEYIKQTYPSETSLFLEKGQGAEPMAIVNGSEALGLGAVRAGLKFAAIYPMTPINALITFLADRAKQLGIVYKQPEDEISGITMAIGASYGGVRSLVATSGGGFALMVEGLSLAGMIEVPLVIDLGMRVGPATGMPTYTEQGELFFAIHAGHGEFARIVLAPSDAAETYELTIAAFHLADKYQIPVILLTDKYLNECQWSVPLSVFSQPVSIDRGALTLPGTGSLDASFKRYDVSTKNGVSPRSVPGVTNGHYYANSYEHDETGHMTIEREMRKAMTDKRLRKMSAISADILPPRVWGNLPADTVIVTWGTTRQAAVAASEILAQKGMSIAVVSFPFVYPFPKQQTKELLQSAKTVIAVEQNGTGQLADLIHAETGREITHRILAYDGRSFTPEALSRLLEKEVV